jgi:2',3'-cyclic-nucleotide 2'-phosphodiesterase (5'-nucleotidase family)
MLGFTRRAAAIAAAAGLATGVLVAGPSASADAPVFRLQLLHASDLEGGVDAIGRAPNFAAIIDALEDAPDMDASLTVSAGDNVIPGPFFAAASDSVIQPTLNSVFNTLYGLPNPTSGGAYNDLRAAGGRIDYSVMNVIGFDASALGNHEWDLGSEVLATNVKSDLRGAAGAPGDRWMGIQFPYLSANLDFSGDSNMRTTFTPELRTTASYRDAPAGSFAPTTPGEVPPTIDRVAPFAIAEEGGEKIGLVGATTPILQTISSPTGTKVIGPTSNDMPALAAVLQPAIDTVLAQGQQGGAAEPPPADRSRDAARRPPDRRGHHRGRWVRHDPRQPRRRAAARRRPPRTGTHASPRASSGDPVAIVSTDGEYSYVGRLVVDFDANGVLVAPDGTPLESWTELDGDLNGPVAHHARVGCCCMGRGDPFAPGTKGQLVSELVNSVTGVVIAKDSQIFGETTVFIDGRRSEVRTQETTAGNLSADANLYTARQYDPGVQVSIKNGGGIRAEIGEVVNDGDETLLLPPQENPLSGKQEGQISQLDIENSLRFNNGLSLLTTTAAGLKELLEHGVSATAPGATPGQFPQIGGMAFSFDPTRQARNVNSTPPTPGDRIRSLVVGEGMAADVIMIDGVLRGRPEPAHPGGHARLPGRPSCGHGDHRWRQLPVPGPHHPGSRVDLAAPGNHVRHAGAGAGLPFATTWSPSTASAAGTPYSDGGHAAVGDLRIQNLTARDDAVVMTHHRRDRRAATGSTAPTVTTCCSASAATTASTARKATTSSTAGGQRRAPRWRRGRRPHRRRGTTPTSAARAATCSSSASAPTPCSPSS